MAVKKGAKNKWEKSKGREKENKRIWLLMGEERRKRETREINKNKTKI